MSRSIRLKKNRNLVAFVSSPFDPMKYSNYSVDLCPTAALHRSRIHDKYSWDRSRRRLTVSSRPCRAQQSSSGVNVLSAECLSIWCFLVPLIRICRFSPGLNSVYITHSASAPWFTKVGHGSVVPFLYYFLPFITVSTCIGEFELNTRQEHLKSANLSPSPPL